MSNNISAFANDEFSNVQFFSEGNLVFDSTESSFNSAIVSTDFLNRIKELSIKDSAYVSIKGCDNLISVNININNIK